MSPIRSILCPVDFSTSSDRAAVYAVGLARSLGAAVHFLHAWEIPMYALPEGALVLPPETTVVVQEASQKRLDACVATHAGAGVPVDGTLVEGFAAHEIIQKAKELAVDLIVMGTHGRRGISHALLGSVAERVVRTSTVPVLTVPPDRKA